MGSQDKISGGGESEGTNDSAVVSFDDHNGHTLIVNDGGVTFLGTDLAILFKFPIEVHFWNLLSFDTLIIP